MDGWTKELKMNNEKTDQMTVFRSEELWREHKNGDDNDQLLYCQLMVLILITIMITMTIRTLPRKTNSGSDKISDF